MLFQYGFRQKSSTCILIPADNGESLPFSAAHSGLLTQIYYFRNFFSNEAEMLTDIIPESTEQSVIMPQLIRC